jgi:hypothetical protein
MALQHHIAQPTNNPLGVWVCQGCGLAGSFAYARIHDPATAQLSNVAWLRLQLLPVIPPTSIVGPWSYARLARRATALLDALGTSTAGRILSLPAGAEADGFDGSTDRLVMQVGDEEGRLRLTFRMPGEADPYVVSLTYPDSKFAKAHKLPRPLDPDAVAHWRSLGYCPACGCTPPPGQNSGHWFGDEHGVSGCILHGRGCGFTFDQRSKTWQDNPAWFARRPKR